MLTVTIKYRTASQEAWTAFHVDPNDYFWHDQDSPVRPWKVDDTPMHDRIVEYLPLEARAQLIAAVVRASDPSNGDFWEAAYQFWNTVDDWVAVTTARVGGESWKELILSGTMPLLENGSQVIRVRIDQEFPQITMNTVMWGQNGDAQSRSLLEQAPTQAPPNKSLERTREG